jgi:ATP-binding cassette subfamily F protein uup
MARAPLLQLSDISLTFGGDPLFDGLSLAVQEGDRIALVGRNGSGKSTLMRIMAGLVEPDRGLRATAPGTRVGYMEQDPDLSGFATLGDYASATLPPGEDYRVAWPPRASASTPTAPPPPRPEGSAAAPPGPPDAEAPELLLLDEPTNHLDIAAIEWLERQLSESAQPFVLISHDRAVLRTLTRSTLWVDRGEVRRQDRGFTDYETWRDEVWEQEDSARHKLDRLIKAESKWAVEGISARRKAQHGPRPRAPGASGQERSDQIRRQGTAALPWTRAPPRAVRVIQAKGLSKSFGRPIVRNLDLTVMRGDRLALVGPNGAGKTTLVNLLLGRLPPDAGTVTTAPTSRSRSSTRPATCSTPK